MSTFWHPDPENAFWQLYGFWHDPPDGPESPGERTAAWVRSYRDADPPAGVLGPSLTGAEAIEVTGFGDPVRTFITDRRPALTLEEAAEPWRKMDAATDPVRSFISGGLVASGTITASEIRPPPPFARTHRGQCQGCGLDDDLGIRGRCKYCAELAALLARNLPGPPPAWRRYLVPAMLGTALVLVVAWVVLYVIFYALLCRRIRQASQYHVRRTTRSDIVAWLTPNSLARICWLSP